MFLFLNFPMLRLPFKQLPFTIESFKLYANSLLRLPFK